MVIVSTRRYGTHKVTTNTKPTTTDISGPPIPPRVTLQKPIPPRVPLKPDTIRVAGSTSERVKLQPILTPPQGGAYKTVVGTRNTRINRPILQVKTPPKENTRPFKFFQSAFADTPNPKPTPPKDKQRHTSNYNTISALGQLVDIPPEPKYSHKGLPQKFKDREEKLTDTNKVANTKKVNQIYDIRMNDDVLQKIYAQQRLNNIKTYPSAHTYIQNHADYGSTLKPKKNSPKEVDFLSGYISGKKVDDTRTVRSINKDPTIKDEFGKMKTYVENERTFQVYQKEYANPDINSAFANNTALSNNFNLYAKMYTDFAPRKNDAWKIN